MSGWPRYPTIYEVNTWVWLTELSKIHSSAIDLSSVPATEWDTIAHFNVDAVWLMGVWERSPAGTAIANRNHNLLADFRRALPDFQLKDNVGSPYCIRNYVVDPHLGGSAGLARAREELAQRGIRLLLDFVPNHVAPDHPWVKAHPEYFVSGSIEDASADPSAYIDVDGTAFACGRDPYFPPWPDVLQLNAFQVGLRAEAVRTLSDIAAQCDGVRCDMAMLLLNSVFERTWGNRAGVRPSTEYWADVISDVKRQYPGCLFIAEAYWDLEWELQQQGFDFCYDKRLYDRLEHESAENVRLHLCADSAYQDKLLRFLENHDEPRAAAAFSAAKERAAAVVISSLAGARLFHEGQLEGRKVRLPVFLGRRPEEPHDAELQRFYCRLLRAIDSPVFREGEWALCERSGWPDNPTYQNVVCWCWSKNQERYLIVVNLSDAPAEARVKLRRDEAQRRQSRLTDLISGTVYDRNAEEMESPGLYVALQPWAFHFFAVKRV